MKIFLRILGGLAIVVLLLVLVSFLLPRQYRVERSLVFKSEPAAILAPCVDLREWRKWGVWYQRDPEIKTTYSEQATGPGSWVSWESKQEGNGKMTVTALTPTKFTYLLEFPDYGMQSTGVMEVVPVEGAYKLVWSDEGDLGLNPINRWFGLMLDKFIGTDFETGLANLKKLVDG
jgi:hypothetical protein